MNRTKRLLAACLLALSLTVGNVIVVDTPAQAAGCHIFSMPQPTGLNVNVNFSPWMWVAPASMSTCHDIQIKNLYIPDCGPGEQSPGWFMWIRFDPTSGADYFSATTYVPCGSTSYTILARDVLDQTKYRFERYIGQGAPGMSATVMD